MLIDGGHKAWFWTTLGLLAAASGAYAVYARTALDGPRGGSVPGLLFGVAGSALMIYAGLISARKKAPTWQVGSAQTWLRGHLWLGSLSVPLILFHAGFRWGGPLEQALLLVFVAIVASGVFGLVLQQFVPRQITSRVPLETFYAQVPHVCRVLQLEADVAVAQICGPLPLAAEACDGVATAERLNQLGVSGKNPLAAVYASIPSASPNETATATPAAHQAKPAAAATRVVRDVADAPSAPPAPKAISAADKIALMRAKKAATPPAETPAAASTAALDPTAGTSAKEPLTPAEKIALMRSGKATNKPEPTPAADNSSAVAAEAPQPSLSAADKIAMMRAAKATKQPDQEPARTDAAKQEAPANSAAAEKPKASLSAADKIAMMRAAKAAKQPGPAPAADPAPAAAPGEGAAPEKPKPALSAAEKIAMMRAAKTGKPAEQPTASTAGTESAPAPAPAAPAAKPTSAAEKIALMRAGKAALSGKPTAGAAPPAAAATAAKPAPAPKPAAAAKPAPAVKRQKPADDGWKQACPEFVKFYLDQVRPFLGVRYLRQSLLADGVQAEGQFAAVGAVLPDELRPLADRLAALCEERRQLAAQVRMHHWLHGWLLLHVPLSLALLALGVVHVIASLYY